MLRAVEHAAIAITITLMSRIFHRRRADRRTGQDGGAPIARPDVTPWLAWPIRAAEAIGQTADDGLFELTIA